MKKIKIRSIRALTRAFRYSMAGLKAAWRSEEAFRTEVLLLVLVIPAGLWLGISGAQKALLIGVYFIVIVVELINSAIESLVDRMGPDHHVLAGRAKDLGSAAVFVSLLTVAVTWGIIAYDRFF